ncbi:MAG: NnrS family protein [Alphaproteobacteria bacterium]|nr:NnrS family protein [Alphaproteobacteria bacterium]
MSTMSQSRAWQGPPVFSYGFRPFFLMASIYAALVVALWVSWYLGAISVPTTFDPISWHVHELMFGYVLAVVAGFLLTAVPNWTGRLPVVGYPLIGLALLWLIGRIAVTLSGWLDPVSLAVLSFAFPLALLFVVAREVIIGNNTNNYVVIAALGVIVAAQALMQIQSWLGHSAETGGRLAIAGAVMLIMIIGGRITPSFTRNWIRKANPGREPTPPGRFDTFALLAGGAGLLLWIFVEMLPRELLVPAGVILIAAGTLHLIRQARWTPDRTLQEPLVLVLHAGYVFVPLGFILSGCAMIEPLAIAPLAGTHAWSAGAFGVMTLAVMTRATLGHTRRSLEASAGTVLVYSAAVLAALIRVAAALLPDYAVVLLQTSGALWCFAFLGFTFIYGPMLLSKPHEPQLNARTSEH